jgi:cation transport ATPase
MMVAERLIVGIKGMTCAGCVSRIEQALRQQDGVISARVSLAAQQATLTFDPATFSLANLVQTVKQLGYEVQKPTAAGAAVAEPPIERASVGSPPSLAGLRWPALAGILAAVALVGLYLGFVTIAQDWNHATGLLWGDRWLVLAIAAGFGTQIGLYVHLRRLNDLHHKLGQCKALTATGTGTSSLAMVACCAHHLTDVLPILGLSAAATFLTQYRIPFMLVGVGSNLVGTLVMLRLIRTTQAAFHGAQDTQTPACHRHSERAVDPSTADMDDSQANRVPQVSEAM